MEISKVNFKTPINIKEKVIPSQHFHEELCSDSCLLTNYKKIRYAIPGASAGKVGESNFLFITDNSLIKRRKYKKEAIWNEFGSKYDIDTSKQDSIFLRLSKDPIDELPRVISACNCSLEMEYIEGPLLFTKTNPNINYYSENYPSIKIENEEHLFKLLDNAQKALKNIHKFGYSHGDPCAHNIIILDDKAKYIDLDTIMPIDELRRERDYFIFTFFTIVPLVKAVLNEDKFMSVISKIFNNLYKSSSFQEIKVETLADFRKEKNGGAVDNYIGWLFNFIYSNLQITNRDILELKHIISHTRVSMLDSTRIYTRKINEIEEDRLSRLQVINKQNEIINDIELDREERMKVINKQHHIIEEIEKDRAERLETIMRQQQIIKDLEKDREEKQNVINRQQILIEEIEKDRSARLEVINDQQKIIDNFYKNDKV